jgi:hypothetical protein
MVAGPSTRERNYIRADVILAKDLEGLVRWRIAFMNESIQAPLPRGHSRYEARSESMRSFAVHFPLDRRIVFTADVGLPDLSAISRSCSSIAARAGASPSTPPSISLGTLRFDR